MEQEVWGTCGCT